MKQQPPNVTIVIDVFRAFTTACYILRGSPARYILASSTPVIADLAAAYPGALSVGKPEIGQDWHYDIPNSPTRVKACTLYNRTVLHRTEAGARGVLEACKDPAQIVLAAGFVNALATADYVSALSPASVQIKPMGFEAISPSLEDDVCATYLEALLRGEAMSLESYIPAIRAGAGQYFFSEDQWQYPVEDFSRCLRVGHCDFAVRAVACEGYALLKPCHRVGAVTVSAETPQLDPR